MSNVLALDLSTACFVAGVFLGLFVGKKKRENERKRKKLAEGSPVESTMLHGHDMSEWNYLGYSACKYVDGEKILSRHPVFMFINKNNPKRRSYHVDSYAKHHTYIEQLVKPWVAGEGDSYSLIAGTDAQPSDFLKQHMRDTFKHVWDTKTKWWTPEASAKYRAAQSKQKATKTKPDTSADGNVVQVDFSGK